MKTLGGSTFCYRGFDLDYNFLETIKSLQECCNKVVALIIESDDGTYEAAKKLEDDKTLIVHVKRSEWDKRYGREKLAFFQNLAAYFLTTDYYIICQADECIDPSSYPVIRKAIETGHPAFLCKRINLWNTPDQYLDVPQHRKPCSTEIIRLAKLGYMSVGDGESIDAPSVNIFQEEIIFWHYGFVRDRKKMIAKSLHMQDEVFHVEHDKRLDNLEEFKPELWFDESDLKLINRPHPEIMKDWVEKRKIPTFDTNH